MDKLSRIARPGMLAGWLARLSVVALPLAIGGCGASLDNLTTGSLFGGSEKAKAPVVVNDPTSRAVQVGMTSARALKCGFNFSPQKLRADYLTAEGGQLGNPAEIANVEKVYDTAFNGVSKAVASQGSSYCSEQKTARIKSALNRHLAGDFTPDAQEPQPQEQGLFGDLSASSNSDYKTPHPWERP